MPVVVRMDPPFSEWYRAQVDIKTIIFEFIKILPNLIAIIFEFIEILPNLIALKNLMQECPFFFRWIHHSRNGIVHKAT